MSSFWIVTGKPDERRDCPDAFIEGSVWKVGDMVDFTYVEQISDEAKETTVRHRLVSDAAAGLSFEQAPQKKRK